MLWRKMLKVKNLEVSFGGVPIILGLSLVVERRKTVALVGESGSGKTVTAHAILRLMSGSIQGEILFEGEDLLKKSPKEMERVRGKQIGMIFQDPLAALNPTMRIGKQIAEGLREKKEAKKQVLELLHDVGIQDPQRAYESYPHQLSGGMRQRALIASALAGSPSLLIADEPTTALDVTIQAQILDLLATLQRKRGMGILLITHDLGVVAHLSDEMVVLYGGRVMERGVTEEIFKSPQHPYTEALLRSLPRLDQAKEERLKPIAGSPPDPRRPLKGCPFWPRCPYAQEICHTPPPLTELSATHAAACWLRSR